MWRFVAGFVLLSALGACNQIFGIPEVTQSNRVGGRVQGLWSGGDGVALRLQADGVDTVLTVPASGAFRFAPLLPPGTSYGVTLVTSPAQHACVVDGGGDGTVGEEDVETVSVACTGPAVVLTLTGRTPWSFDRSKDTQTFEGSVITQDVTLTVGNNAVVTSASVDGTALPLGEASPRIALPLGEKTVQLALTTGGGLSKTYELVFDRGPAVLEQLAYGKASNTGAGDSFSAALSLSGDTLAVGAPREDSSAMGVGDLNQGDNGAADAGAVYVFVRSGATWAQQAYLKASNTEAGDNFGAAVSLDGNTLAVGASREDSAAMGVNGNQADNTLQNAGAVYVFTRAGTAWAQQAYLKASNTDAEDVFGTDLSLSGDTLAVGAYGEASAAPGIDGDQNDDTAVLAGAVYVFTRTGTTWAQQAYLKASNPEAFDRFGLNLALSGELLAVGAQGESSSAAGLGGNQADNSLENAGAAFLFSRAGTTWTQRAYLKASVPGSLDRFGSAVTLSGSTLVVGAREEASNSTGINGSQTNDLAAGAGAIYLFQ